MRNGKSLRIADSVSLRVAKAVRKAASAKFAAFTVAELIVVIAVLAILATIGFLALSGYSQDAKDSAVKANVRAVQTAISTESASTGNSPRHYVAHDPAYALSGAYLYVEGDSLVLTGGNVWEPPADSNYTAWTPRWDRLKLDAKKFSNLESVSPFRTTVQSHADSSKLFVGAVDVVRLGSVGGKPRQSSFIQIASVLPDSRGVVISGDFPKPTETDEQIAQSEWNVAIAWLIRNPYADGEWSETAALTETSSVSASSPSACQSASVDWYQIAQASQWDVVSAQKIDAAMENGSRSLTQAFVCSNGTFKTEGTAVPTVQSCSAWYEINGTACSPVPGCWTSANGDRKNFWQTDNVPFGQSCAPAAEFVCDRGNWTHATFQKSDYPSETACVSWTPLNCFAATVSGYQVPATVHGHLAQSSKTVPDFQNGTKTLSQEFACSNGAFVSNGAETTQVDCAAGYVHAAQTGKCEPQSISFIGKNPFDGYALWHEYRFVTDAGYFLYAKMNPTPAGLPKAVKLPLGIPAFAVSWVPEGSSATISFIALASWKQFSYFERNLITFQWTNLAQSVTINSDGTATVRFSITDGGAYDLDRIANGTIIISENISESNCLAPNYWSGNACYPSPVGYYVSLNGQRLPNFCRPGNYQNETGQFSCKPLDAGFMSVDSAGYYTNYVGVAQTQCSPGYYCPAASDRVACPSATYRSDPGASVSSQCVATSAGYRAVNSVGTYVLSAAVNQALCPAGNYCPAWAPMVACPIGTYNPTIWTSASASCLACPTGTTSWATTCL